jgi:hypothetical protein
MHQKKLPGCHNIHMIVTAVRLSFFWKIRNCVFTGCALLPEYWPHKYIKLHIKQIIHDLFWSEEGICTIQWAKHFVQSNAVWYTGCLWLTEKEKADIQNNSYALTFQASSRTPSPSIARWCGQHSALGQGFGPKDIMCVHTCMCFLCVHMCMHMCECVCVCAFALSSRHRLQATAQNKSEKKLMKAPWPIPVLGLVGQGQCTWMAGVTWI